MTDDPAYARTVTLRRTIRFAFLRAVRLTVVASTVLTVLHLTMPVTR